MTTVLSLDPGRLNLGYSIIVNGTLVACGRSTLPKAGKAWALGKVCEFHWLNIPYHGPVDRVVVEEMRLTKARDKTLVRAISVGNGLLELTAIAGFIAGRCGRAELVYVNPAQCPKEVTQARVAYLLSPAERLLYEAIRGKRDDVADAVFHGLRNVGRAG
jgi:hypothetical protein